MQQSLARGKHGDGQHDAENNEQHSAVVEHSLRPRLLLFAHIYACEGRAAHTDEVAERA